MRNLRKHEDEFKRAFHRWEIRMRQEERTRKKRESQKPAYEVRPAIFGLDKKEGL